jgi:hypothetical protein
VGGKVRGSLAELPQKPEAQSGKSRQKFQQFQQFQPFSFHQTSGHCENLKNWSCIQLALVYNCGKSSEKSSFEQAKSQIQHLRSQDSLCCLVMGLVRSGLAAQRCES